MKKLNLIAFLWILLNVNSGHTGESLLSNGVSINQMWSKLKQKPYKSLPKRIMTFSDVVKFLPELSKNVVNKNSDFREIETRVIHANGICLLGEWKIQKETPYSGYFKNNSRGLVIIRVSSAAGGISQDERRSIGLAGKLFPTTDIDDQKVYQTANFFASETLVGKVTKFTTKTVFNNKFKLGSIFAVFKNLKFVSRIGRIFGKADKSPFKRKLDPIAMLSIRNETIVVPDRIRLSTPPSFKTISKSDFRDEWRVENYKNGELKLIIELKNKGLHKKYEKVGEIVMQKSVTSRACDFDINFPHPKHNN